MLATMLKGAGGVGAVYSDITVMSSGAAIGSSVVTFSPAPQTGDVVFMCLGLSGTRAYTIPSGYVKIADAFNSASPYAAAWYYKVMGATPDTTIDLNSTVDDQGFTYYVLRGVQTENPVIEHNYVVSATSSVGLTPPPVSVFPKCLVLISGFASNGSSAAINSTPSGYTGSQVVDVAGGSDTYVRSAYKTITATGTETPGTFGLNSTATSYLASSIVVRPYSASYAWRGPEFVAMATAQQSVAAAAITVNKPAGTAEGDLMVSMVCAAGGGDLWTGDTGWTEVCDQGAQPDVRVAYKIAGASEPSSYTFTSAGSGQLKSGCILTYRYAAYDTIAGAFVTSADPMLLNSVAASLSQSVLLAFGSRTAAAITLGTPSDMTARATDSDATAPSYKVCDQRIPKGPSGTRSMSTGSTTGVSGIMLTLKPTRSL